MVLTLPRDRNLGIKEDGQAGLTCTFLYHLFHLCPGILEDPRVIDVPFTIRKGRKHGVVSFRIQRNGPMHEIYCFPPGDLSSDRYKDRAILAYDQGNQSQDWPGSDQGILRHESAMFPTICWLSVFTEVNMQISSLDNAHKYLRSWNARCLNTLAYVLFVSVAPSMYELQRKEDVESCTMHSQYACIPHLSAHETQQ